MNPRSLLIGSAVGLVLAASANPLLAQSSTETYTYDALGRLIAVVTSGGQNNAETHSICYDDAGNRTQYASDVSGIPATCTGAPPPPANLAIGNASVTEGGTLSFVVTRSGNTAIAASASYATANGTALAPGDYTTKTGTVSFLAGETSKTITVTTIDDTAMESSETMSVTLSGPSADTAITTASGTGTINDNDVVSNSAPVATDDTVSVSCSQTVSKNLTSNDSDPDGNYPLSLTAIVWQSGLDASATIASASSVEVTGGMDSGQTVYRYTVQDSLGAIDTGLLTITTTFGGGCNFLTEPPPQEES